MIKKIFYFIFSIAFLIFFFLCANRVTWGETGNTFQKVIIIGIDGLDYNMVRQLLEQGQLPNLKKLSDAGSFVPLNSTYPPHSPVAWTSIATGVNPGENNIFDFIRRDPSQYLPQLSLSEFKQMMWGGVYKSYVRAPFFWEVAGPNRLSSAILFWPLTFPAGRIQGKLLSGMGVPDVRGFLSGYTYYSSDLAVKEPKDKIVHVQFSGGKIETYVKGPKVADWFGGVRVAQLPMTIALENKSIVLNIQNQSHLLKLHEWSDWISVRFDAGWPKSVHAIFKVNLRSLNPFGMYMTSVQINPKKPLFPISYPRQYSGELAREEGYFYTLGMPEEIDGYVDGYLDEQAFIEQLTEIQKSRERIFWSEFKTKKAVPQVLAFIDETSSALQHVFWNDKVLTSESANFNIHPNILHYLKSKDNFVGQVLNAVEPGTLILVVSDHGFTSLEREVNLNTWLVENGFMTLTKPLREGDAREFFKSVNWQKTKAYALGFNSIYINLKNRESKGSVENKNEVVYDLIRKLESLIDPATGKRVVYKAYRKEEVYTGKFLDTCPDIIVGYYPGYRASLETVIGGFKTQAINTNTKKWKGDHLVDPKFVPGVFISSAKLNLSGAISAVDVAPTILSALGLQVPKSMTGKAVLSGE